MFTEASEPSRQGNSIMAAEEKEKLAKKNNISACKDFIHGINQLRADRSFFPWWCASLLLVSEAQTPGWNVSLCVQVERALCASVFPVCYPACQKNSGRDMRGKHSGELHPILFFFSVFISPRDVSSHLKGCVSQHRFSVLTSQLWGAKIATGKKKKRNCENCQRLVVVVPVNSRSSTWKRRFCVRRNVFSDNAASLLTTDFTVGDE